LKFPRQCPFALLVKEILREGEALGSEEGKELGRELYYKQRNEVEEGIYCV
jgi:hypothetical protein